MFQSADLWVCVCVVTVMDVLAAATQMERDGHHICHLEVGFSSASAVKCCRDGTLKVVFCYVFAQVGQPQSGAPQKVGGIRTRHTYT